MYKQVVEKDNLERNLNNLQSTCPWQKINNFSKQTVVHKFAKYDPQQPFSKKNMKNINSAELFYLSRSEITVFVFREGGRLAYWLPVIRQIYTPDLTPSHPCLTVVEDCEQVCNPPCDQFFCNPCDQL